MQLIEAARKMIRTRFKARRHQVAAAVRTRQGSVYSAVNLGADVDRVSVCAEAIALGMAVAEGDSLITAVAAVDRDGRVVSPCGVCREMISDYAPECEVVVPGDPEPAVVPIGTLLPLRYQPYSH